MEKNIKEKLIPNIVSKDRLNPQFCDLSSLPLKLGGLNFKLSSDNESYLEWSKETTLILLSQDPVTAKIQQENVSTKIKKIKSDRTNQNKSNFISSCDIRPERIKMQIQQIRSFLAPNLPS